ncbi:MAG TPA: hypothetical protein DCP08_01350 [Chloroflexi bacterium]|nr:hypothetical protein [Chloroflexota bacterium]
MIISSSIRCSLATPPDLQIAYQGLASILHIENPLLLLALWKPPLVYHKSHDLAISRPTRR